MHCLLRVAENTFVVRTESLKRFQMMAEELGTIPEYLFETLYWGFVPNCITPRNMFRAKGCADQILEVVLKESCCELEDDIYSLLMEYFGQRTVRSSEISMNGVDISYEVINYIE